MAVNSSAWQPTLTEYKPETTRNTMLSKKVRGVGWFQVSIGQLNASLFLHDHDELAVFFPSKTTGFFVGSNQLSENR